VDTAFKWLPSKTPLWFCTRYEVQDRSWTYAFSILIVRKRPSAGLLCVRCGNVGVGVAVFSGWVLCRGGAQPEAHIPLRVHKWVKKQQKRDANHHYN